MNRQLVKQGALDRCLPTRNEPLSCYGFRQKGAAALLATLLLVVIASLSALVVNKAAFNEQKLSGVDVRSKEVYAAAVGALEYGASQLELAYLNADSGLAWPSGVLSGLAGETVTAAAFANAGAGTTIDQQADTYTPIVVYTLLTDEIESPAIIEIAATVTAVGDTQVTKTITMQYLISDLGTSAMWNAPPVVVENGLSGVTGTPDIIVGAGKTAIGSINAEPVDVSGNCVDPEGDCVDPGFFDVNGTSIDSSSDSIGNLGGDGSISLHETFFGNVTAGKLKAISEMEASAGFGVADRTIYYIDAGFSDPSGDTVWNGNAWNDDIGSGTTGPGNTSPYTVTHAAILYFDESVGCPPVNGNVEIWGLVFYEAVSCDTTVGVQGGGKADIYGTIAFSGDLSKYTANTNIYDVDLSNGGGGPDDIRIVTALPGSWIDF